jgi:hypothetical protein
MVLILKQEAIKEELGDRAGLALCYWNKGELLGELGDVQEQKRLWVESIAIDQDIGLPSQKNEKELAALVKRLADEE